jgi:hypothetical protein
MVSKVINGGHTDRHAHTYSQSGELISLPSYMESGLNRTQLYLLIKCANSRDQQKLNCMHSAWYCSRFIKYVFRNYGQLSVNAHNEDFPNPVKLEKGSLHGNISCNYERVSWQERTALLRNATMSTELFRFR